MSNEIDKWWNDLSDSLSYQNIEKSMNELHYRVINTASEVVYCTFRYVDMAIQFKNSLNDDFLQIQTQDSRGNWYNYIIH